MSRPVFDPVQVLPDQHLEFLPALLTELQPADGFFFARGVVQEAATVAVPAGDLGFGHRRGGYPRGPYSVYIISETSGSGCLWHLHHSRLSQWSARLRYVPVLPGLHHPERIQDAELSGCRGIHKADHAKRRDQLDPMLASTGGFTVHLGVGCPALSDFKLGCDGQLPGIAIVVDADEVYRDRRQVYEQTGDPRHLAYERKFREDVRKYSRQNPEIRRNYGSSE